MSSFVYILITQCFQCTFQYQCSLTSGPPLILPPLKIIGAELAVVFPLAEEKGALKWHVWSSGSVERVNQEDGATATSYTSVPAGGNVWTEGKYHLKKVNFYAYYLKNYYSYYISPFAIECVRMAPQFKIGLTEIIFWKL